MAIQTLSRSLGASLGTAAGQGLESGVKRGIDLLTQKKLMQLQEQGQHAERQRYAQGLEPLLGKETSQFLSNLNPEERKYALQNVGSLMQLQGLQNNPQEILGQPGTGMQALVQQLPGKQQEVPQVGQQGANQPQQEKMQQLNQLKEQEPSERKKLVQDIFTSPQEKREREKLELKKKQIEQQEIASRFKETKEERKEIIHKSSAARQNLHDLNRLEELQKSGKLDTPGYVEFLKRSGLDIPALMNPESEEFNKVTANFIRGAKDTFGSRISNFEIENFLKTLPSLSQSNEGRKRIIANLKYINNASLQYNDALKEVLKENKGVPPYDLQEQVDDRIGKKLDSLADKFREDLAKPVPKSQNKLVTALQSVLGNAVGAVTGLLSLPGKIGGLGGAGGASAGGEAAALL